MASLNNKPDGPEPQTEFQPFLPAPGYSEPVDPWASTAPDRTRVWSEEEFGLMETDAASPDAGLAVGENRQVIETAPRVPQSETLVLPPEEQDAAGQTMPEDIPVEEPASKQPGRDEDAERTLWRRHGNERWVVEDEGRQPLVRPAAAARFKTPPPDNVIDGVEVGCLTFRAASVRGISHQERGEPRQDAYAVRYTQDQRWLVGCIADGVSEGQRSHEAAAEVVEKLTGILVTFLTKNPSLDWPALVDALPLAEGVDAANTAIVERAREHLRRAYRRQGAEDKVRDLEGGLPFAHARTVMSATALVFVIATAQSPEGGHRAVLANLAGDSSAFLLHEDTWVALTAIKNDGKDIFSGSVRPLPDRVEVRTQTFTLPVGEAFVVMTDGLGDPLGAGKGTVGAFLRQKWRTPPDVLAFAQHLAFYKRTFTDDRTAVMVWANPPRNSR